MMIQEIYMKDPWKMLVCCIFLNQTQRKQVDGIIRDFFRKYPNPTRVVRSKPGEIYLIIKSLGFGNIRTKTIMKFSEDWIRWRRKKETEISELHGIGKYAYDSWKIFQEGKMDINVEDKKLKIYLEIANDH